MESLESSYLAGSVHRSSEIGVPCSFRRGMGLVHDVPAILSGTAMTAWLTSSGFEAPGHGPPMHSSRTISHLIRMQCEWKDDCEIIGIAIVLGVSMGYIHDKQDKMRRETI